MIVERTRIAYILDKHSFLPILDNGKVLTYAKQVIPSDAPILVGWKEGEAIQDMAAQLANTPNSILNLISEIHYTPNASDERHITVYMNDGIEVSATIDRFAKKLCIILRSLVSYNRGKRRSSFRDERIFQTVQSG